MCVLTFAGGIPPGPCGRGVSHTGISHRAAHSARSGRSQHPGHPGGPPAPGPTGPVAAVPHLSGPAPGWLPPGEGRGASPYTRPRRGGCEASPERGHNLTKVTERAGAGTRDPALAGPPLPPHRSFPTPPPAASPRRLTPVSQLLPATPQTHPRLQISAGGAAAACPSRPAAMRSGSAAPGAAPPPPPGRCPMAGRPPAAPAPSRPQTASAAAGSAALPGPPRRAIIYAAAAANQRRRRRPRAFPLAGRGGAGRARGLVPSSRRAVREREGAGNGGAGRDPGDRPLPASRCGRPHLPLGLAAPSPVPPGAEHFQGSAFASSPGNLVCRSFPASSRRTPSVTPDLLFSAGFFSRVFYLSICILHTSHQTPSSLLSMRP